MFLLAFFSCTISFLRFKMVHRFNINGNNAKVLNRQTIALWNNYAIAHGSHFQRFCSLSLVLDMHFSSFKRFFLFNCIYFFFMWVLFLDCSFLFARKKNCCDFDIWIFCFCYSFCMKSVVAGDEPQEMCICQKNRNLPKINCHLAENSSIQITAQSAF